MDEERSILAEQDSLHGGRSFTLSGCDPDALVQRGSEKIPLTCAVRYGYMGYVGEFRYAPGVLKGCGHKVVIQSNRGIEIGERISLTCSGCEKSVSRQQMVAYAKAAQSQDFYRVKAGRILRTATVEDLEEERHIQLDSGSKLARASELAKSLDLPMKFIVCEHLFGGERIIFHFMSENRVDFRELVKQLAHEYHTRIEMHQVGARDEARLVADYEICGRECCCKTFLKTLRPVSMRMAKLQKATLDPSKVSGRCGRLRCCLRFEHEGYEELNKALPKTGTRVRTDRGIGTIRDRQVLTQLVTIEYDEGAQRETVGIEMVLERGLPKAPPAPVAPEARATGGRPPARRVRDSGESEDSSVQAISDDATGSPQASETPKEEGRRRPRGERRSRGRRRSGSKDRSQTQGLETEGGTAASSPEAEGSPSSENRADGRRTKRPKKTEGEAAEGDEAASSRKRPRRRGGRRRRPRRRDGSGEGNEPGKGNSDASNGGGGGE